MFLLTGKTQLMKAATQLNLVTNLAHPSFKNIAQPINAQAGYDLPVSTFAGYEDGTLPAGTAKFENAVLHCSFQNGYQKTVFNVTNVPSYVHMLQFVQFWQLKQKWLQLRTFRYNPCIGC